MAFQIPKLVLRGYSTDQKNPESGYILCFFRRWISSLPPLFSSRTTTTTISHFSLYHIPCETPKVLHLQDLSYAFHTYMNRDATTLFLVASSSSIPGLNRSSTFQVSNLRSVSNFRQISDTLSVIYSSSLYSYLPSSTTNCIIQDYTENCVC